MSSKRFGIIIFVLLILAAIIISIVMAVDEDTGDFNIKYVGNAKKYETFIKQGVNRWSSIGTGGVYIEFRTTTSLGSGIVANTLGNTITIGENRFNSLSANLKVLTIAHEVGHALGIGTWNETVDILTGQNNQKYLSNTKYPKTAAAYIDKVRPTGITLPGAPIENGGHGKGSDLVHWEDDVAFGMQKDLMIYRINSSATVISIVDLTFLQEIGKKVDLDQAQTLKASLSSVVGEYIFEEEVSPYTCGTCNKCNRD